MKYIKTSKTVRINVDTLKKLKDMNYILQTIAQELEGIAGEDSDYRYLADSAWHASASLDDFLEAYKEEINGCQD